MTKLAESYLTLKINCKEKIYAVMTGTNKLETHCVIHGQVCIDP
jgi:hypothetical protein